MIEFKVPALTAPDASIIGVIQETEGALRAEALKGGDLILEHPLSAAGALLRIQTISRFMAMRRAGSTLVLISHDEELLAQCADEVWWLRGEEVIGRGHPAEVLPLYRRHVADLVRKAGAGETVAVSPSGRSGDGRASLERIELLGEDNQPTSVWRSGENATIRIRVRFVVTVSDPVVGILIRTRVGLNVYGTNTQLEDLHAGPVAQGDTLTVTFRFRCDLCPGDYTVTAASHDPDGVWHDWQEDAVAFAVSDFRYTAGVANLRARVHAEVSRG